MLCILRMFLSYLSHFWDILICIYMALRQGLSLGESSYYGQYIWCRGVLRQGGADLTWSLAPKHCSGPRHIYAQLTKPLLAKQELCLWTLLDQVWLHLCMKDVRFGGVQWCSINRATSLIVWIKADLRDWKDVSHHRGTAGDPECSYTPL